MRVAFLSFDFGEYSVRLASALAHSAHVEHDAEILLLLPEHFIDANRRELHSKVLVYPFVKPRIRQPLQQVRLIRDLHREIIRFEPDVVHYQHRHPWFNLSLPLFRRYPLVITIHDPREHAGDSESRRVPQVISDFGYHHADQVIVHADYLKRMTVDAVGIPAEKIHVVPMIALGKEAGDSVVEDECQVLFFGRIWGYKGLEYLIRAEPLIAEQIPDVRIVIAGEGEDFERYRRMMRHPDRFTVYNEYVSDETRDELFQRASVVVLPYVEATQSAVIPIAYTFAKPVVATTVGGLPELVDDGRSGYLVPPRDERAIADAVVRLLRDRDLRHQMGRYGRRMLDAECAPHVVAAKTLDVYRQAVRQRSVSKGHQRPAPSNVDSSGR
jgi:glycosyltransferase involved in cell wall biosynthesis